MRTTPRSPTSARAASNCGLTSATNSASRESTEKTAGSTAFSDINDTSVAPNSIGSGKSSGFRKRAFTRSIAVTRGSLRSR